MLKEIDAALAVLDDDKYEPLRILQEDLHYFIIKGCLPISRAIANIFRERIEEYNEPQRFYDLTRRVESLVAKLQSADNEASEAFVALRREIPDDYKLAEVDKSAIGEITSFMRQLAGQLKHDSTLKLPSTFGSDDKDAIYQAINNILNTPYNILRLLG